MTISTTTTKVTYIGNGATTVFTFPFVGNSETTLEVLLTDLTSGSSTVLSSSLYTVALNAPPSGGLWGVGGSVTYPNTGSPPIPITSNFSLTILRDVPYEQLITLINQGPLYPQSMETGLDVLEMQIQQLGTDLVYSLKTPQTDLVPPNDLPPAAIRAGGVLGFDSTGQPTIIFESTQPVPGVSATTRKVTTTGTATISMTTADSFGGISIYQSSSPVTTVQLPSNGGPYPIFDGSRNSGTSPIKVLPPGGLTILGQPSCYLNSNGMGLIFFNDGTQIIIN